MLEETPFEHVDGTNDLSFSPDCHPGASMKVILHHDGFMCLYCASCGHLAAKFRAENVVTGSWTCPVCPYRLDLNPPYPQRIPLCPVDSSALEPLTWQRTAMELAAIAGAAKQRAQTLENAWPDGFAIPLDPADEAL